MANAKELKDRIKAVKETKKITNAMYLISSTKLRRAKLDLAETRPYFDALRDEIRRILRAEPEYDSRYFGSPSGAYGVLVITADKGLAGAYNINVIRKAEEIMDAHPDARLLVVGEYGCRYFAQHRPDSVYLRAAQSPTPASARALCADILERFDSGELGAVHVVYTDMKNTLTSQAVDFLLLPLERRAPDDGVTRLELIPSAEAVLGGALRSYISGFLYAALLDSFCAEQNARVSAMDAANVNAQELLGDLTLQLNRSRQAAITQEITEISAGAQAQKNKRKKGGASS
ncbi:MAG: ATP synthase F1 subunit gamma [Ruminococcaceae bacterium]|jgi:F-type H+-transporting ATPase subunit gamma|nr:ATP synthase F1 subunit gamma [Oscillospiraceae bacterium]